MLNILFLEPFYGGSHRDFTDGLIRHSRHSFTLKTLPARFWKWRMRGAALHFSRAVTDWDEYDLILTSDLMSASDLKALVETPLPPMVVYFHESQLSYPLPPGERMDYQFGFTDITTGLAADYLIFNSHFHHEAFFSELPRFIRRMPEHRPGWAAEEIRAKSRVIYPGAELASLAAASEEPCDGDQAPLILWNHRWEFDKDPETFFRVLDLLDDDGYRFNLALLGENFQAVPKPFIAARERYGKRIIVDGFRESREEYRAWLNRSSIVVSCAIQENFGLAVVEAIVAGAYPLLPDRLSYPELIPDALHGAHLYKTEEELAMKLAGLLDRPRKPAPELATAYLEHDWRRRIAEYDDLFEEAAGDGQERWV